MIKFFRRIRQRLLSEGRLGKYLLYAFGEIVLVVIGILIALQVNNNNIDRLDRENEVKYLGNIKIDLEKDIVNLDYQIEQRRLKIDVMGKLLAHMNGEPITDIDELASSVFFTLMEDRFVPNNSTYNELSSSGNLNIITNETIKKLLLDLQERYKYNDLGIEHEIYEYREYISRGLFKYTEMDKIGPIYNKETTAAKQNITAASFNALFGNPEYKNGLVIPRNIAVDYIPVFEEIKDKSQNIVILIDQYLAQTE